MDYYIEEFKETKIDCNSWKAADLEKKNNGLEKMRKSSAEELAWKTAGPNVIPNFHYINLFHVCKPYFSSRDRL